MGLGMLEVVVLGYQSDDSQPGFRKFEVEVAKP